MTVGFYKKNKLAQIEDQKCLFKTPEISQESRTTTFKLDTFSCDYPNNNFFFLRMMSFLSSNFFLMNSAPSAGWKLSTLSLMMDSSAGIAETMTKAMAITKNACEF
jgi:hypothetical protein